ncbi:MAG: tetratricopeptide repeat protein, partial [Verrucomicrobiota bacterium]
IRVVDPSVREVPPIEVPYFDPERQVYRVAKSRPVRLEVTGAKVITAMDAEGVDPVDPSVREVRSLEEGIAYNYEGGDAVTAMGFLPGRWLRGPGFWGPFLVFPLLYFVLGFIIRRGEQQRADPEGHRSAKALAAFRQEVEGAGLPEEAFAAFRRYLGDRLHLKSEALTYPDVEGLLQESGVSEQLLGEVKALFDLAEGLRYSGGGREDDLGNMADRATKVVEQAEMVLREAKGGQSNVWWRRVPFLQKAAVWMCGAVFLGMGGTSWGLDEGEQEELFREGNALFRQANELAQSDRAAAQATYEKAIRRYERLLQEEAPSGKLYYNVGNAYFRQGDVGRAILSYRRAERLLPGDPNVVKNLAFARDQRVDRIDAPPRQRFLKTAFFWHHDISPRVRAALWGWTYACLWTALALVLVLRRPWLRKVGMGMGALSALLLVSLVIDAQHLGRDRGGVILADEVTARKGDSQTYEPSFDKPLHAGTEFVLLEARPGWVHIQLPDGKAGWLPDDSVGLVRG